MPASEPSVRRPYARYRAPAADGAALVQPDWKELLAQLEQPFTPAAISLGGVPLASIASEARRDLVAAALRYTRSYTDALAPAAGPLVVSGHQPELFHPGVWFKNFALDSLAKASGGVGVHLVIDSDLCRETHVLAPTGSLAAPRRMPIAYDQRTASVPYEERRLVDRATFDTFPGRTAETVAPFIEGPLVGDLWKDASAIAQETDPLLTLLSAPRHRLERRWGSQTLEVPFSKVTDSEGFRRLAAELVLRASETGDAYNGALAEYRAAHHFKNAAQPLPDLHRGAGWIESPLWVWSEANPQRRPLFVKPSSEEILLGDRHDWSVSLPADADGLVEALADLRTQGVKLRSRALVTTLYCRLVLADLFLHGIGGAKYDQVTDRFAERLLGVRPPEHATLTATLRLPIEHPSPTQQDRRDAVQRLRDLAYHPERFAADSKAAAIKSRWVATPKTPDNAAERHEAITAANRAMAASLEAERLATEDRLAAINDGLRAAAVLDSREHSFCLFPADDVCQRLTSLAAIG